jgi:ATP phosphoribosyltransferase regulatory subunit
MNQHVRIPGTLDYTGKEAGLLLHISDICNTTFAQYGYERVVLPILERSDIFLQRSGEEIRRRMYMLQDPGGRELCLRPEMTISASRAFLEGAPSRRLPARLSYLGEVFRYDKIREGRYRQFLQAGVENIGGKNRVAADVEVMTLALDVFRRLGIPNLRLVLGDLELATEFINSLPISSDIRRRLLETFRRREAFNLLLERFAKHAATEDNGGDASGNELAEVFSSLGERASRLLVRQILSLFVERDIGYRDLNEIADRFLHRFTASESMYLPRDCYEAIQEYLSISGPPDATLRRLEDLMGRVNASPGPALEDLQRRIELLDRQKVMPENVILDLGFRRGIEYYTGFIFEVHCDSIGRPISQICGGGRYDKLLSTLGAPKPIPAVGFAAGVDRLYLAVENSGGAKQAGALIDALVVSAGHVPDETIGDIASSCREAGWRVRTDFDRRRLSDSLRQASEDDIPYVIIAGEDEVLKGMVRIRDMSRRSEELRPIETLTRFVKSILETEAGRSDSGEGAGSV